MVLAAIVAGILALLGWQLFMVGEPASQGKPLSVWLVQYGTNHWSGRSGELEKQAETAIRLIGKNAIPICLRRMNTRESRLKLKLMTLIPKQLLAGFHRRNVYDYRIQGAYGLIALGEGAKSSVPALIALLNDKDPDVRYPAVFTLRCLGPVAQDALPSLINCLKDPEFTVQSDAIIGLGTIRQQPELVVPILVEFLAKPQNPQHSVILRDDAMGALCQFGAQAKLAVPELLRLLNDDNVGLRSDATNALKIIDPEAAAKAGVQ